MILHRVIIMKSYKELILEQLKAQKAYIEIYCKGQSKADLSTINKLLKDVNAKGVLSHNEFDNYDEEMLKIDERISKR